MQPRRYTFENFDLSQAGPSAEGETLTSEDGQDAPFPAVDVLLVDDEPEALEQMAIGLRAEGITVACASNAPDALKIMHTRAVSILLTDIKMPRVSGLMLAAEMRDQLQTEAPSLIFISGYADRDTVIEALRYGPKDFLLKPVKINNLVRSVQQILVKQTPGIAPQSGQDAAGARTEDGQSRGARLLIGRRSLLEILQEERKIRASIFEAEVNDGPAWQILVDLWSSAGDANYNYVSSIAVGAGLPLTTALRHIEVLIGAGLVEKRKDQGDARRVLLLLTEKCRWLFSQYKALLDQVL